MRTPCRPTPWVVAVPGPRVVGLVSVDTESVRTYYVHVNLTLSVDEQIVARARTTAAAMGLSLNQAVRDYLAELAGQSSPDADLAEIEHLSLAARGNRSGWRFDRAELHDRA